MIDRCGLFVRSVLIGEEVSTTSPRPLETIFGGEGVNDSWRMLIVGVSSVNQGSVEISRKRSM